MPSHTIGILHPGDMGISVTTSAQKNGHRVFWVSAHRSEETKARAEKFNLIDAHSLKNFVKRANMLISVCPPHSAEQAPREVQTAGFSRVVRGRQRHRPQQPRLSGKCWFRRA